MPGHGIGPGLIWGLDFTASRTVAVQSCDSEFAGGFRWLHLNLADHGTRHWLEHLALLPDEIGEMLLSEDTHQRAVVEGDSVGCVLHDFERDFDVSDTERIGALRIALMPTLMITARHHPLRSADLAKARLQRSAAPTGPDQALELLVGAIVQNVSDIRRALSMDIQRAEEAFLEGRDPPTARDLIHIRQRLAQLHRLLSDMRGVFQRLENDEELPEALLPTVEKQVQRLQSLDADILGTQAQLRVLREEIDIQAAQRTNQNLYILSIVTALMLPATLVTGIFGMNTGGMPFAQAPHGTLIATMAAASAAAATYFLLRWMGFMRR